MCAIVMGYNNSNLPKFSYRLAQYSLGEQNNAKIFKIVIVVYSLPTLMDVLKTC